MFGWLHKLISGGEQTKPATEPITKQEILSVETVLDAFLVRNPKKVVFMIHALVEAGGADLSDSDVVHAVCEKIETHGYQYPFNPTLRRELNSSEWLPFLQWHARSSIAHDDYLNENTILELINRFRNA